MPFRHAITGAWQWMQRCGLFGVLCLLVTPLMAESRLLQKAETSVLLDITHAGNRLVAVGERGHVLLSDDQGAHWAIAPTPDDRMLTAVFFVDSQRGWAVGHEALILVTNDGGQSWQAQHDDLAAAAAGEPTSPLLDIWFADDKTGWAVGAFGLVLHTRDGGEQWHDWTERVDNPEGLHINAVNGLPDGTMLMAGERGLLMRSMDHGAQWQQVSSVYDGSLFGIQRFAGQWLVFGLRGHAYASADGVNWSSLNIPLQQTLFGSAATEQQVWLVGQGGTVLSAYENLAFRVLQKELGDHLTAVVQQGDTLWMTGQGGLHSLALPEAQP